MRVGSSRGERQIPPSDGRNREHSNSNAKRGRQREDLRHSGLLQRPPRGCRRPQSRHHQHRSGEGHRKRRSSRAQEQAAVDAQRSRHDRDVSPQDLREARSHAYYTQGRRQVRPEPSRGHFSHSSAR